MILVTLGTQDKQFYRILEALEDKLDKGLIKDEIVVQAGCSADFKSKYMKIFDLIPMDEFDNLINKCDLLITHGGVGSIIAGLKCNKKVIAAARLSKYNEHVNDHQLQIIDNFSNEGYIIKLDNFNEIDKIIKSVEKFKPNKFKSNASRMIKLIDDEIMK